MTKESSEDEFIDFDPHVEARIHKARASLKIPIPNEFQKISEGSHDSGTTYPIKFEVNDCKCNWIMIFSTNQIYHSKLSCNLFT